MRVLCGPALVQIVSNDAGENKNRTSDKMKTFTYEDGLSIQAMDLAKWKKKLSAECYCDLEFRCKKANEYLTPSEKVDGLKVFRGQDLTEFVLNWKPAK